MTRKTLSYLAVIFWAILIFYFSSIPIIKTSDFYLLDFIIKKNAHFFEFFILFLLLYNALPKKNHHLAFLIALLYAFSDEIHQLFVPGRTASLRDVLIDSLGITTALILEKTGVLATTIRRLRLLLTPKTPL